MHFRSNTFVFVTICFLSPIAANGSWLSNVTGINIDLAKQIGVTKEVTVIPPPPPVIASSPTPGAPAPQIPQPIPMATAQQKAQLQARIDRTVATYESAHNKYDSWALGFVIVGVLLALAASVAGFLKRPITAGILSLSVAASTGVLKAVPINDRATYYQALYSQSLALQNNGSLAGDLTAEEDKALANQLTTLLLYGSKLPGIGDVSSAMNDLAKDTKPTVASSQITNR